MRVTKLPQSCLLIEKGGNSIVIDPGNVFLKSHSIDELSNVNAALYTHQHADHYDETIARTLIDKGVKIFANQATADLIGKSATVVTNGQQFEVAGFNIAAYELEHCLLANGNKGPQNTGYVVDDVLFHPGDGKELSGIEVQAVALPISGPDISILDAINFAKQLKAKTAIPIHYDVIPADAKVFADFAKRSGAEFDVVVLADGEAVEL